MAISEPMAPRLRRVLFAAGVFLLALAAVVALFDGTRLHLDVLGLSVASPFRPAGQGLALLLVAEALGRANSRLASGRFVVLLGAFVTCLVLESPTRVVGDGHEYVAMAWNMAQARPPALLPDELARAEALLPPKLDGYRFSSPELVGADGRQDFYHPWLYSLAAVPLVRAALWMGASVVPVFAMLNIALLLAASYFSSRRYGPRVTLLVLGGAVLWWIDKPHTEVFLVSLLVSALSLIATRPGWALVLLGLAALQNPTLVVALVAGVAWLAHGGRLRERGARRGLAAAVLLVAAGPAYYMARLGNPSPLSATVVPHWPGLAELLAPLVDSNLGLVAAWPALFIAVVAGLLALASRDAREAVLGSPVAAVLGAGTALVILVVATQPANLNSGGTRSLSRYALWLVPLAVPLLARIEGATRWGPGFLAAMAAGSLITSLGDYHPRMRERYVSPTPLAEWLWRHWPRAAAPLPEVFAERTTHFEGAEIVPSATERCEKVLLVGDRSAIGAWPLWCRPQPVPPFCQSEGVYCYAHPGASTTTFATAPRQRGFHARAAAWYWTGAPDEALVAFLAGIPWPTLWFADPRKTDELFAGRKGLGQFQGRLNRDILLVWIERPRYPASISLRPLPGHRAIVIDPLGPSVLADVAVDPVAPTTLDIPYVAPLLIAVTPSSLVPAAGFARSSRPTAP